MLRSLGRFQSARQTERYQRWLRGPQCPAGWLERSSSGAAHFVLRSDDTGLVLPLKWASDNQRVRVRLRFDMRSEDESSFEHIAILTPGA